MKCTYPAVRPREGRATYTLQVCESGPDGAATLETGLFVQSRPPSCDQLSTDMIALRLADVLCKSHSFTDTVGFQRLVEQGEAHVVILLLLFLVLLLLLLLLLSSRGAAADSAAAAATTASAAASSGPCIGKGLRPG